MPCLKDRRSCVENIRGILQILFDAFEDLCDFVQEVGPSFDERENATEGRGGKWGREMEMGVNSLNPNDRRREVGIRLESVDQIHFAASLSRQVNRVSHPEERHRLWRQTSARSGSRNWRRRIPEREC
jgi:hypothetical protein